MTHAQWKDRFTQFIYQVPFEKKHLVKLMWSVKHEQVVHMFFGINTKKHSKDVIAEIYLTDKKEIKRILRQARTMCERYYTKQKRVKEAFYKRTKLAEEIRNAILGQRL